MVRYGLLGKVLSNAAWIGGLIPITLVLGIIQMGFQARLLGPDGLGVLAFFTALCAFASGLFKPRSSDVIIAFANRAITEGKTDLAGTIIRTCIILDVGSSIIVFILISIIVRIGGKALIQAQYFNVFSIFALTIIISSTHISSNAILRVFNRFDWLFWQAILVAIFKAACMAFCYYMKYSIERVIYLLVIISLVDNISIFVLCVKAAKDKYIIILALKRKWADLRKSYLKYYVQGYLRSFTKTVQIQSDTILVGYLGGAAILGKYKAARVFLDYMDMPIQAIQNSISKEYAPLWFDGKGLELKALITKVSMMLVCFGLCMALIFYFFGDTILVVVFGTGFADSVLILQILVWVGLLSAIITPISSFQLSIGQAKPSTVASFVSMIAFVILLIYLVPRYGAVGAAISRILSLICSLIIIMPPALKILRSVRTGD